MKYKLLLLVSLVLFLLVSPVSANYTHTGVYTHLVSTQTGTSLTYAATTSSAPAQSIQFMKVENAHDLQYMIIDYEGGLLRGVEGAVNTISFNDGLSGTFYLSVYRNIFGTVTGSSWVVFFDNWDTKKPLTGDYRVYVSNINSVSTTDISATSIIGSITYPTITPGKMGAVLRYSSSNPMYLHGAKITTVSSISISHTIDLTIEPIADYGFYTITTYTEPSDNDAHIYLSTSTDEQTTSVFYRKYPLHGDTWGYIDYDGLSQIYLTSNIVSTKKQWLIQTGLDPYIPPEEDEEGSFILHQINQPPFYTGSFINFRLEIPESIYDVVERIEFTTTKGGEIYDTRNYDRNGETFQVGYAGAYTIDDITHQYTPDTPNTYSEMVSVFDEDYHLIFTASKTDTITQSESTSTLRIEVESEYDGSKVYDVTGVISWGGREKFNGTVLQGVYETQIPKNTVITATFSKAGYIERTGSITADSDYTRWIFPLSPSSVSIDPSECLVELTATDGFKPLPNVRILFDGNVKYTGQTGKASWITTDIGTKTYSATLTGYQGYNGVLTTVSNTTVSQTFVLTPIGGIITPTITPTPTVTPGGNITPPAIGEEGWGIIEAIRWLAGTFLGVHEESLVDAILAMCLIVTCALVIVQYTRDAGGAIVGAGIGFLIALVIGWIPIWIVFVGMALGGFIAFIMLSRGG